MGYGSLSGGIDACACGGIRDAGRWRGGAGDGGFLLCFRFRRVVRVDFRAGDAGASPPLASPQRFRPAA